MELLEVYYTSLDIGGVDADIFKASDRRLGKRRLAEYFKGQGRDLTLQGAA